MPMTWSYFDTTRTQHEVTEGGTVSSATGRLGAWPDAYSGAIRPHNSKKDRPRRIPDYLAVIWVRGRFDTTPG